MALKKSYMINRVGKNLMFAYKVGWWDKKGPKYAYLLYERSLTMAMHGAFQHRGTFSVVPLHTYPLKIAENTSVIY